MDSKMDLKKHFMNEETEECVKIVFTNLIKKSKTNDYRDISQSYQEASSAGKSGATTESSGVIVNGKVYHFNLKSLLEKEPTNNLLNIYSGEIKKRVNNGNHTIEYMEQIPDFNLVIDYINGYNYKDFEKVFKTDYARIKNFHLLLTKLGMKNLVAKLYWLYPLLNINGIMHTVSREFINTLEPQNNLFDVSRRLSSNTYSHFKDRELFNEYFREYLLGKKTLIEAAATINKLKQIEICNTEGYTLAKIENDLWYYGLEKLQNQVFH